MREEVKRRGRQENKMRKEVKKLGDKGKLGKL